MKDAAGHGSNTRGMYLRPNGRSVLPTVPVRGSGEYPARNTASDEAAAQALMSAKSSAVPIHPAMAAGFGRRSVTPMTNAKVTPHPVEVYGRRNPL